MPKILTIAEAAKELRISEAHARNLERNGLLPSVRLGRRILIPAGMLEKFIEEMAEESRKEGTRRRPNK